MGISFPNFKISIRTIQVVGYSLVVLLMGIFAIFAGLSFISNTVFKETQLRVEMDLNSAWTAYNEEKATIQMNVSLVAQHEIFRHALRYRLASDSLNSVMHSFCDKYHLDFLILIEVDSTILSTSGQEDIHGHRTHIDPVIQQALSGNMSSGTTLIDRQDLLRISKKLADQAYISLVPTRLARPTERQVEERGLILESAIPVFDIKNDVCGVLYGGILLNRRFDLVDRIRNAIFEAGMYKGKPLGTVTIFLWDTRITTNVLQRDHLRAIGTQISEEVYIQVLEKGERFGNRAFVVNDWYLSAYDPIRDPGGKIIGILYVGLLEEKYLDYKAALTKNFLAISLLALLISIILAVYFSGKIRQPILKLVDATRRLSTGDLTTRLNHVEGAYEIAELSKSFNRMVEYLEKDRKQLQETSRELESAYKQADDKNRAYMETLGFVTHELKSPLASIVFALNSIRERLLGPLTDAQLAVLKSSARSADYLNTTIANFLNLSRIEEGALNLKLAKILLRSRIIDPVIQLLSEMASDNEMKIETTIPSDLEITCDPDLLTSVFQNLVSNAIKYGKKHGTIIISRENESDADLFWFSVYNEGIGFSPQDLQDLFKKFTRFGLKEYSTKTGTGLGLFVTKNIIQNHGGQIRAESEYGLWAKFNFSIPRSVSG